jgi:hypothetical protein
MTTQSRIDRVRDHPYRNIFAALVVVVLVEALVPDLIGGVRAGDLMIAGLILAALATTAHTPRRARVGLVLGVFAIVARLVAAVQPDNPVQNGAVLVLSALFFVYLIWNILRDISTGERPTAERIFGALCAYVFIGVVFALLYAHLEYRDPSMSAFAASNEAIVESAASETSLLSVFIYFSFVTLTTLGYGDITPVSDAARTLAWMEALIGQLYLAVMVAGFVADHISKGARGTSSKG